MLTLSALKTILRANPDAIDILRDPDQKEPFILYCQDVGLEWGAMSFEEAYEGEYDNQITYVEYLIDEGYVFALPPRSVHGAWIGDYIAYETLARDMFINDYMFIRSDKTGQGYIFRRV